MAPRDNPDPAEAGAYFPSQASLRRAPRTTDYDGPAHPAPDGPTRGRILMIATEERYLPIRGGILFSTGNHPVETLVPLLHLEAAGFDTDVATLSGAMAKFEHWAFPHDDEAVRGIYERMLPRFRGPQRLRGHRVDPGVDPDADGAARKRGDAAPGASRARGLSTCHAVNARTDSHHV